MGKIARLTLMIVRVGVDQGIREGLEEERTACVNRIRGLRAAFGLAFAKTQGAGAAQGSRRLAEGLLEWEDK